MPDLAPHAAAPLLEAIGLSRRYEEGLVEALRGVDLSITDGEFVAIQGPSGCGKSTFLHLLGALDDPTSGLVRYRGRRLGPTRDCSAYRATTVGFVFQASHLLPTLTALENVQVPMFETAWPAAERRRRAESLLGAVGLSDRLHHRPPALSGGERQRAAIARSLANDPALLLLDEPTGNLDSTAAARVMALLGSLHASRRLTIIIVTHDAAIAAYAQRRVRMLDGRIAPDVHGSETAPPTP